MTSTTARGKADALEPNGSAGSNAATAPRRRLRPMQLVWGALILFEIGFIAFVFLASTSNEKFSIDYTWHMQAAQRLLDTGSPYWPYQLEGPYTIWQVPILYPPVAFVLIVPFLWLPPFLWWVLPVALLVFCVTRHRPPMWAWAVTLACFCWLPSLGVYVFGNPGMWIVAFVAAGTVWAWPFVLVLLKPTFAPIALLGARRRSWWVALLVLVAVSLPFGHLWIDWLIALRNSDVTIAYNFPTIPLMIAPLIPWLADPRHPIHDRVRSWRARRSAAAA